MKNNLIRHGISGTAILWLAGAVILGGPQVFRAEAQFQISVQNNGPSWLQQVWFTSCGPACGVNPCYGAGTVGSLHINAGATAANIMTLSSAYAGAYITATGSTGDTSSPCYSGGIGFGSCSNSSSCYMCPTNGSGSGTITITWDGGAPTCITNVLIQVEIPPLSGWFCLVNDSGSLVYDSAGNFAFKCPNTAATWQESIVVGLGTNLYLNAITLPAGQSGGVGIAGGGSDWVQVSSNGVLTQIASAGTHGMVVEESNYVAVAGLAMAASPLDCGTLPNGVVPIPGSSNSTNAYTGNSPNSGTNGAPTYTNSAASNGPIAFGSGTNQNATLQMGFDAVYAGLAGVQGAVNAQGQAMQNLLASVTNGLSSLSNILAADATNRGSVTNFLGATNMPGGLASMTNAISQGMTMVTNLGYDQTTLSNAGVAGGTSVGLAMSNAVGPATWVNPTPSGGDGMTISLGNNVAGSNVTMSISYATLATGVGGSSSAIQSWLATIQTFLGLLATAYTWWLMCEEAGKQLLTVWGQRQTQGLRQTFTVQVFGFGFTFNVDAATALIYTVMSFAALASIPAALLSFGNAHGYFNSISAVVSGMNNLASNPMWTLCTSAVPVDTVGACVIDYFVFKFCFITIAGSIARAIKLTMIS